MQGAYDVFGRGTIARFAAYRGPADTITRNTEPPGSVHA